MIKLRFDVLGFHVGGLTIDLDLCDVPSPKLGFRRWVRHIVKGIV